MSNDHLIHNEDLIFHGSNAALDAVKNLDTFRMTGYDGRPGKVNLSLKYDGIAVFVGIDPADGKFFVSNKAFLNKTPKLYKSLDEISSAIMNQDLKNRLVALFTACFNVDMKGKIYQGDLMYIRDDLMLTYPNPLDTTPYITFHANTLIYGMHQKSEVADMILSSRLGIAWHTEYTGSSITTLSTSSLFNRIPFLSGMYNFWVGVDKFYPKNGCNKTYFLNLVAYLHEEATENKYLLDIIAQHEKLIKHIIMFNNKAIRNNTPTNSVDTAINFIETLPTDFKSILPMDQFLWVKLFGFYSRLQLCKNKMLADFDIADRFKLFIKLKDGTYKETRHEGFVLQSPECHAVKIINRNEFSYANFSDIVVKAWDK